MIEPGTKKGLTLRGPVSLICSEVFLDGDDTADARADGGARSFRVPPVTIEPGLKPGVLHGLYPGGYAVMDEDVHAARILGRHVVGAFEVLDHAAESRGELRDIEDFNVPDAAAAVADRIPARFHRVACRADHAHSGNCDPPAVQSVFLDLGWCRKKLPGRSSG